METDTSVVDKFGALLEADRTPDRGTLELTWLDVRELIDEHINDREVLIKVLKPLQKYEALAKSNLSRECQLERFGTDGALTLRSTYEPICQELTEYAKFVKGKVEWFETMERYQESLEIWQEEKLFGKSRFGKKKNPNQGEGGNMGICQRCNKSILVTAGV